MAGNKRNWIYRVLNKFRVINFVEFSDINNIMSKELIRVIENHKFNENKEKWQQECLI